MQNEKVIARTAPKSSIRSGVRYDQAGARINVGALERVLSAIGGGLLIKRNFFNCTLMGIAKLAIGAGLIRRGFTGHCNMYEALKFSTSNQDKRDYPGASEAAVPVHAEMSVAVPPLQAYELWRDPDNQRWIFGHFATVESMSLDRVHWQLRNPIGFEWDALIVADSPGELIRWETLPGAGIPNEGRIRFMATDTGGTRLIYDCRFDPPAGALAIKVLKIVGITPESIVGRALRRFKDLAEMGMVQPGLNAMRRQRVGARAEIPS